LRLLYVAMTRAEEKLILSSAVSDRDTEKIESNPAQGNVSQSGNWFQRIRSVVNQRDLSVHHVVLQAGHQRAGKRKRALIERKPFRDRFEKGQKIRLKQQPAELTHMLDMLKPHKGIYFERIDLPVSAYQTFCHDEAHVDYRHTYELGSANFLYPSDDAKHEMLPQSEMGTELLAADFGTWVHQVLEHVIHWRSKKTMPLSDWVSYYGKQFDGQAGERVKQLVSQFLASDLYSDIQRAKQRLAEIPFVLRLKRGMIQGTLDLLYQTSKGEWIIVDYKTSEIVASEAEVASERYKLQMELYALACHEILGITPKKAVVYFVKPDAAFEMQFDASQFSQLKNKFESIQQDIIQYRKDLICEQI